MTPTYSFYLDFNVNSFDSFTKIFVFSFFAIISRYLLVSGLFYYFFWIKQISSHSLHQKKLKPHQIRFELYWSTISTFIFSFASYLMLWLWQNGYTKIYTDLEKYTYGYLIISFILLLFFHEIYFYFSHVLMHKPKLYKKIHSIHHHSAQVTPWASFSFHPYETITHALFIPLFILLIPIHPLVIFFYLIFMTITAVSNHLGYEIIKFKKVRSWFISGEHHSIHHEKFKYNFGLYFTFIDKWLGTEYDKPEKENSI